MKVSTNRPTKQAFMDSEDKLSFDPKSFLTAVDMGETISKYEPNYVIFSQGDPADSMYYVHSGTIKVTISSEEGKEAVIALLGSGDFCGEKCLIGEPTRMSTATTLNDCAVIRIGKEIITRLIRNDPTFAGWFISYLLRRNNRVEADLVDQIMNSSEKRLARLLLTLANYGKDGKLEPLVPMISQEIMAEMIGTTRPRVNFYMNKFRDLGLIDYNGALHVHSSLTGILDPKSGVKPGTVR
jgi:CRP/FNR family cyclic AMP-dependent transcriptional regulator